MHVDKVYYYYMYVFHKYLSLYKQSIFYYIILLK